MRCGHPPPPARREQSNKVATNVALPPEGWLPDTLLQVKDLVSEFSRADALPALHARLPRSARSQRPRQQDPLLRACDVLYAHEHGSLAMERFFYLLHRCNQSPATAPSDEDNDRVFEKTWLRSCGGTCCYTWAVSACNRW